MQCKEKNIKSPKTPRGHYKAGRTDVQPGLHPMCLEDTRGARAPGYDAAGTTGTSDSSGASCPPGASGPSSRILLRMAAVRVMGLGRALKTSFRLTTPRAGQGGAVGAMVVRRVGGIIRVAGSARREARAPS